MQGAGDIVPDVGMASPGGGGSGAPIDLTLVGDFVGLIALIVIAAMFMTAEYRRGLIRVTFAASPNRGRVLAAKAIVIAAVTFVTALIGTTLALVVGLRVLHSGGASILPVPTLTLVRIVAGTAAVFAVAAVLVLALGALLHRTAVVVVLGIVVFVLGWLLTREGCCRPASRSGSCGLPRWRRTRSSSRSRHIRSSPGITRQATASTRWRRGLAFSCCACGPPRRSAWRST